jgi:DNA-binding transcriptional LysR family regulator
MTPSLDLLRTFLAIYREGSLTRAARQLSLSQPAVTAQLRALEEALGRPLFDRMPRGVKPTAMAELLARRVADPLDELGAVLTGDPDATPAALAGVVHIGGPVEFITARVVPALAGLVAHGLQVRISFGVTDKLLQGLVAGSVDVAVLTTRPRRRGVHTQPMFDEEFTLVAAPSWADRWTKRDLRQALRDAPLLAYAEDLPIIRRYWQTVFELRPARNAAVVVPNLHAVLAGVLAGAGYSVLPTYLCAEHVAAGRLVVLHEPAMSPLNTLYLARRAGPAPTAALATVYDHLLAEI